MPDQFRPTASTVLAVTTTTASVALPGSLAGFQNRTVRLFNDGLTTVCVEFGTSSVAAVVLTSMALAPGTVELFRPTDGSTHIAAIAVTGTATLRVTAGEGE